MAREVEIFENMPIGKAVAKLVVPTVLGQLVTMIYNLADTFFIGRTGNELMVAAASFAFPLFMMLTGISNLFGIGGGSLISRLLGAKNFEDTKRAASFSFYGCVALTAVYSGLVLLFMTPLLKLLGASNNTIYFGYDYLFWTVVVGGIPTTVSILIGNLLRSEGRAKQASAGVVIGGVLNIILDPIFIFTLDMNIEGAAMATMISNAVAMLYFFAVLYNVRSKTVISISPKNLKLNGNIPVSVMSVGVPSFIALFLASMSNIFLFNLVSGYGDAELAAIGIVKKIDMIPLNTGIGLSQGVLPIIAYNYSSGNYRRMKSASSITRATGVIFAVVCIIVFELFSNNIVELFIKVNENNYRTVELGGEMLKIACLATPFMIINLLMNTMFQAIGKAKKSMIFSCCRQGIILIPCLFIMDALFGLYGLVWTQLIADAVTLVISFLMYRGILKEISKESL